MTRPQIAASIATWERKKKYRTERLTHAEHTHDAAGVRHWSGLLKHANEVLERRRKQLAKTAPPLRVGALEEAERCIGIMEVGGNNSGAKVSAIIHENGGTGPEPWCGDFVAHCYRHAGSLAVTRAWASVYFLGIVGGMVTVKDPKPGDIVRYTFDHTGIFVKHLKPGLIETIEGNTGRVGALSDSSTGGDGVYRKERPTSLVANYRRVLR